MRKKIFVFIILFTAIGVGFWQWQGYRLKKQNKPDLKNAKAEEIRLTFIEGWTVGEMAAYLDRQKLVEPKVFAAAQSKFGPEDYPLLASKPNGASLDGFLFPDTYNFFKPKTDYQPELAEEIIAKMLDNFTGKFTSDMEKQAQARGMSVFEILTLASIIEKEAGSSSQSKSELDQQRKIIAGIFYNRLEIGMALQSDATVNFVTKKNTPAASAQDIAIDSPYNTYKYPGLPPGPICSPSLSSIMAALYPSKTNYFYFLHSQQTGEIIYSRTFEEHVRNKAKYL